MSGLTSSALIGPMSPPLAFDAASDVSPATAAKSSLPVVTRSRIASMRVRASCMASGGGVSPAGPAWTKISRSVSISGVRKSVECFSK